MHHRMAVDAIGETAQPRQTLMLLAGLELLFVISGVLLALMDRLSGDQH